MDKKRIIRFVVCLILVCCILVNVSPISAKAFALTASAAIGYTTMALLLMGTCGVVFSPQGQQTIRDLSDDLDDALTKQIEQWVKTDEDWADLQEMAQRMYGNMFDDYEDPGTGDHTRFTLAEGILDGIAALVYTTLITGAIDLVGDDADPGWAYYNGILLPDFSLNVDSSYPKYNSRFIYRNNNTNRYYLSVSMYEPSVEYDSYYECNKIFPGISVEFYYASGASQWNGGSSISDGEAYILNDVLDLIWSSHDLHDANGALVFPGSAPSSTQTITVEPDAYVGDLPDQIQNGEKDQDDIKIPAVVDFSKVFANGETAEKGVTNTLQQLADGTLSYEEYMDMITPEDDVEPDPTVDPTESTEPTEDPDAIPEDLAEYTLDLKDFFPFCLPFDIYEFLSLLSAEPEAPRFEFTFNFGEYLGVHTLVIDLSQWDSTAQLLRRLELLLFIVGLAMATRNYYIRG